MLARRGCRRTRRRPDRWARGAAYALRGPVLLHVATRAPTRKTGQRMKHVAAYLLAQLGGKADPSAKDVTDILGSVGIEADSEKLDLLLGNLKGRDIVDVIAAGRTKMAAMPSGGGGGGAPVAAAAAAPSGGGGAGAGAAPAEKAKEPEPEEEEEASGFDLFD
ncbi:hypothetical protein KFE25_010790 [Diacronema lutheri]|uniref:60S acidic ribosomal protein P2 n=1 Tax=Diacronema lutheri TaxID=2081491 RepID=A0A8J5XKZ2_DIALT|nr:hypothetical protein KFE25_010790 [Diacronema lutheri]